MDKLDRLIAIEEIKQLKARYFRYLDTKDWQGMATIFADDAVFDARTALSVSGSADAGPGAESNSWIYEGGKTIVEFISSVAADQPSVHHGHCHEIEVLSDTEARGVIAMEDLLWDKTGEGSVKRLHGWGHYHEEYRKVGGQWRIWRSKLTRLNVFVQG